MSGSQDKRDYAKPQDGTTNVPEVNALAPLDHRARTRGLVVILINSFLMWGGFFMVVPLLSVHYVEGLGWDAGAIGLVLAVRQLTQQGLTLGGGVLADRLGAKGPICAGLFVRCVGFGAMAWADTLPRLLLAATVAAVGGALFEAPMTAAVAALTDEANRARYFALSGVVGGLGMTVGPLVGSLLLGVDFALLALVAGACYVATGLVTLIFLPAVRVATERRGLAFGVGLALRDRPFVTFNLLFVGYWFMWVQLTISLPLKATALSGTTDAVGWVYALNAGMSVLLQYPLVRVAERWLRPMPILVLGVADGGGAGRRGNGGRRAVAPPLRGALLDRVAPGHAESENRRRRAR